MLRFTDAIPVAPSSLAVLLKLWQESNVLFLGPELQTLGDQPSDFSSALLPRPDLSEIAEGSESDCSLIRCANRTSSFVARSANDGHDASMQMGLTEHVQTGSGKTHKHEF